MSRVVLSTDYRLVCTLIEFIYGLFYLQGSLRKTIAMKHVSHCPNLTTFILYGPPVQSFQVSPSLSIEMTLHNYVTLYS